MLITVSLGAPLNLVHKASAPLPHPDPSPRPSCTRVKWPVLETRPHPRSRLWPLQKTCKATSSYSLPRSPFYSISARSHLVSRSMVLNLDCMLESLGKVFCFCFLMLTGASQVTLVVKNLPANVGDTRESGSKAGSERSPGKKKWQSIHFSCLENPMNRGAWWVTVHGVTESWTWLSNWTHTQCSLNQNLWEWNLAPARWLSISVCPEQKHSLGPETWDTFRPGIIPGKLGQLVTVIISFSDDPKCRMIENHWTNTPNDKELTV